MHIRVAVALMGLALATFAAGAEARMGKEFFGLVVSSTLGTHELEMMKSGKVGTERFLLAWSEVQPTPGPPDWHTTDQLVGDLAAQGIRTLPFFYGTPSWVGSDPLRPPIDTPLQRQEWRTFLAAAATRYGPGGDYWTDSALYQNQHPGSKPKPIVVYQILNEQNSSRMYKPKPSPQEYATLLHISAAAIRDVQADAQILLGGMFGTPTQAGGIRSWSFLRRLYEQGAKDDFDAVAIHPYSPNLYGIKYQFRKIRKVMKQHHDGQTPTWVTELGWASASREEVGNLGKGLRGQKRMLHKSFRLLADRRKAWKVSGVTWFTWRDQEHSEAICVWCETAGLIRLNGEPKPAWREFKRFTG